MKINLFYVSIAVLIMVLAVFFYVKGSYLPGAVYFTQADQKLETVLRHSGIKENLSKYYEFEISESALNSMINSGRYDSCSSYKFVKNHIKIIYVSFLKEILSRNKNKFEYNINENTKIIYIKTK